MDKFAKTFEDLIRRSVAPSASFFVIFFLVHYINGTVFESSLSTASQLIEWMKSRMVSGKATAFNSGVFILLIVGVSYIMSVLHNLFFGTFIKGNFEIPQRSKAPQNILLRSLRVKVCERIRKNKTCTSLKSTIGERNVSDYFLYQVLGGKIESGTKMFVDKAKSYGIVYISVTISLLHLIILRFIQANYGIGILLCLTFVVVAIVGYCTVIEQYRVRAIRLYSNFLTMPDEQFKRVLSGLDESEPPEEPPSSVEPPTSLGGSRAIQHATVEPSKVERADVHTQAETGEGHEASSEQDDEDGRE